MRKTMMATGMVLVAFAAHAQQSNFTGPNGQYQGSVFKYGRSTTFTDRNGAFAGEARSSWGQQDGLL